jgi:molybdopterin/thiamine biosynthesis adenylyltransferase
MTPHATGAAEQRGKSVVLVGAGNIGSHLLPLVARMPEVDRITVIDRDRYDATNIASQDIAPADVNGCKALVQARRARRINPGLKVTALHAAVEDVPLGLLAADVLIGAVDNNATRQHLNTAATRLGVVWCDGGVEARGLLARVSVYAPGPTAVCVECTWDSAVYDALEFARPCAGAARAAPTGAPASLGALAAALLATQCGQVLRGETDRALIGREVVIDANWSKHYVTTLRRRADCRFDHARWRIEWLPVGPDELTFARAFALAAPDAQRADAALGLAGFRFARRLRCGRCGATRSLLRLSAGLGSRLRRCPACDGPLVATGADMAERLAGADLPAATWRQTLARAGLRAGDVFTIAWPRGRRHFGLALADPRPSAAPRRRGVGPAAAAGGHAGAA